MLAFFRRNQIIFAIAVLKHAVMFFCLNSGNRGSGQRFNHILPFADADFADKFIADSQCRFNLAVFNNKYPPFDMPLTAVGEFGN